MAQGEMFGATVGEAQCHGSRPHCPPQRKPNSSHTQYQTYTAGSFHTLDYLLYGHEKERGSRHALSEKPIHKKTT